MEGAYTWGPVAEPLTTSHNNSHRTTEFMAFFVPQEAEVLERKSVENFDVTEAKNSMHCTQKRYPHTKPTGYLREQRDGKRINRFCCFRDSALQVRLARGKRVR
jgi:hypothetical protein